MIQKDEGGAFAFFGLLESEHKIKVVKMDIPSCCFLEKSGGFAVVQLGNSCSALEGIFFFFFL